MINPKELLHVVARLREELQAYYDTYPRAIKDVCASALVHLDDVNDRVSALDDMLDDYWAAERDNFRLNWQGDEKNE